MKRTPDQEPWGVERTSAPDDDLDLDFADDPDFADEHTDLTFADDEEGGPEDLPEPESPRGYAGMDD
jgi:hypothetical protein